MSAPLEPRRLSVRAFAKLYDFEGECTYPTPQTAHFWEPLEVDVPEDARPSLSFNHLITFYDHTGNRVLARDVRCHDLGFSDVLLLAPSGEWYQVGGGRVIYRDGRWWMRHDGHRNNRVAFMMNAGFQFYKAAEAPHPLAVWWRKIKRRAWLWWLDREYRRGGLHWCPSCDKPSARARRQA